jgi:hypothetical protein
MKEARMKHPIEHKGKKTHVEAQLHLAASPLNLRAAVQVCLDRLTFIKPLHLKNFPADSNFTQCVRVNDSVVLFLDDWGGRHYSFAVFEHADGRWLPVRLRIASVDEAVAVAIQTLTKQALTSPTSQTSPCPTCGQKDPLLFDGRKKKTP